MGEPRYSEIPTVMSWITSAGAAADVPVLAPNGEWRRRPAVCAGRRLPCLAGAWRLPLTRAPPGKV